MEPRTSLQKGPALVIEPVEDEDSEPSEEGLELEEKATKEEPQPADYAMHTQVTLRGKRGSHISIVSTQRMEKVLHKAHGGFVMHIQQPSKVENIQNSYPKLVLLLDELIVGGIMMVADQELWAAGDNAALDVAIRCHSITGSRSSGGYLG
ncbi:hypothetical protein BHE74_00037368 [Ensete ventricosum]|nr:hypothetical protein BHE74_00037368 [Ensete ventricosum]